MKVYKKPRKVILNLYGFVDKVKFFLNVKPKDDLVIVSGADSSHFKSLVQFIKSVIYYEPWSKLVIYDLGLVKTEADYVKANFPEVLFRTFDYSKYPSYFNIKNKAGRFAWKPVIIHEVLTEFHKMVIWLDAGCLITQPLYQIRNVIKNYGFYSPISGGTIKEWTHPQTLEYMKVPDDMLNNRNLAGTAVAINFNYPDALKLVELWEKYALIEECSAPQGATKQNHRYQSILTILAYQLDLAEKIPNRRIGFKIHQDID